jgi:proteasome accessory factor C
MSDSEKSIAKIDDLIGQLHSLSGESIAVDPNPNLTLIAQAQRAIAGRKMLEIEYVDSVMQERTVRKIIPLSIYVENSFTYLASFCTTAQGTRNFRFDRIVTMTEVEGLLTEVSASSNDDPGFTATVKVSGRKRAIAEFLSVAAIPADGQFSYAAFSPRWLEKAALAFAPDLQIASPVETRAAIAREIEATLALYRS